MSHYSLITESQTHKNKEVTFDYHGVDPRHLHNPSSALSSIAGNEFIPGGNYVNRCGDFAVIFFIYSPVILGPHQKMREEKETI